MYYGVTSSNAKEFVLDNTASECMQELIKYLFIFFSSKTYQLWGHRVQAAQAASSQSSWAEQSPDPC